MGADLDYARTIDQVVTQGIADGQMPGAVVVIARRDRVEFARAYGMRQVKPAKVPMTLDTVFDLASLTKPIATATSVMKLVEQGKIELDRAVADYLPEFGRHGKDEITVRDLLLHVGGLIPDNALSDYDGSVDQSWERICALHPRSPRGAKFSYTDVGFIVLGKLVEKQSGLPLDQFARQNLFVPLGMSDTMYNPGKELIERTSPTEMRDGKWIKGQVHDPRAYRLKGVAGHAGLFSSAQDLVRFGQMILGEGTAHGEIILRPATVEQMIKPHQVPRGTRALGWDHQSPYSRNRGKSLSVSAIGHGGFTGTVIWIDPKKDIVFVLLSSRLHPDGNGSVNTLAGEIATAVGESRD